MRVKIHHEGTNILVVSLLAVIAINLPLWLWIKPIYWAIASTTICGILYMLAVNFFRSPRRHFQGNPVDAVVSSADGKVVAIEEVYEPEVIKGPALQVSVFMSIFNVHANWFPVNGEVTYTAHHPGRFMAAYLPKSSVENERSTVAIRTPEGQTVVMRQVAGALARRIVTYAYPGVESNIDDHMGFIKFGSRIDLYLPIGTEVNVKIGDVTTGGVTLLGRLHPELDPALK